MVQQRQLLRVRVLLLFPSFLKVSVSQRHRQQSLVMIHLRARVRRPPCEMLTVCVRRLRNQEQSAMGRASCKQDAG